MTDRTGKRAVIISNIKSNSIEQAIFILKSHPCEVPTSAGSGIVAEAQEIINSYINTIEKNRPENRRRRRRAVRKAALFSGAVLCLAAAACAVLILKF